VNEEALAHWGAAVPKERKRGQHYAYLRLRSEEQIFELRLSPDTRTKIKYLREVAINLFYTIRKRRDKRRWCCDMPAPRNSHEETQGFQNEESDPDD